MQMVRPTVLLSREAAIGGEVGIASWHRLTMVGLVVTSSTRPTYRPSTDPAHDAWWYLVGPRI
jgi:hypothetical protein